MILPVPSQQGLLSPATFRVLRFTFRLATVEGCFLRTCLPGEWERKELRYTHTAITSTPKPALILETSGLLGGFLGLFGSSHPHRLLLAKLLITPVGAVSMSTGRRCNRQPRSILAIKPQPGRAQNIAPFS